MRKAIVLGTLAVLAAAGWIGWRVGACYVANSELQGDMRDLAAQNSYRIGLAPLPSEEELRDSVLASAKNHGIELNPQQVTVQRTMDDDSVLTISLAADYDAPVDLLGYSFDLHFTPSSSHSGRVAGK